MKKPKTKNKTIRIRCTEINTGVTFIPRKIEFFDTGEPKYIWKDDKLQSYRFPEQLDIYAEEI